MSMYKVRIIPRLRSSVKIRSDKVIPPFILQEKTATENGVVVPDSGYAGLSKVNVDVPPRGRKFTTGTVVFTNNLAGQTITHNLGVKPSIFLLYAMISEDEMEFASSYAWRYWDMSAFGGLFDFLTGNNKRISQVFEYYTYGTTTYKQFNNGGGYYNITATQVRTDYRASYNYLRAGIEYRWIAIE